MAARGTEVRPGRAPLGPRTAVDLDLSPLPRRFFSRPTLEVARDLLGRLLVRRLGDRLVGGWIVEAEAYIGEEDPACHAAVGRTERNTVMYGPSGHAYVYFSYGQHHCVNVVTGGRGRPEAVLIRALQPAIGQEFMRRRRGARTAELDLTRGPGRLCQALGIDLCLNGAKFHAAADPSAPLALARGRGRPEILGVSARIGIRRGLEYPWRFYDAESPWVSRARPIGSRSGVLKKNPG